MSPRFLSRFGAVVLLHDLGLDELVRIFLEAPESGYTVAREYFASHGKCLTLSPAAVRRIARRGGEAAAPRCPRAEGRLPPRAPRLRARPRGAAPGSGALVIDVPEVERALRRE